MSVQRRIDAFFTLADRGARAADVLFDEDLFEDATLYVQQVVERVAHPSVRRAFFRSHRIPLPDFNGPLATTTADR